MSGKIFILGYAGLIGVAWILLTPMPQTAAPKPAKQEATKQGTRAGDYLPPVTPEPVTIQAACRKAGRNTEICTAGASARDIADAAALLAQQEGIYLDQPPPDWRDTLRGDE